MDAKTLERLKARYFRTTPAHPEGSYGHYGDCEIYVSDVCTCGLLHDLLPMAPDTHAVFPDFWPQWHKHESALEEIRLRKMGAI